jgi:glycerol-3-phosphate dehydrogenase (NAD(P)+)
VRVDQSHLHVRARERGVNPLVYWLMRAILQPFFHLYFRLSRIGREHIPQSGPVILAANHRSFLDPFVIGTCARRPVYYVAKRELFEIHPIVSWLLSSLGAFPVNRGAGDAEMVATARTILERGGVVVMFPEGTRTRPGALGRPKRGVGRLALETGAPVVPVAVIGTEAVRKGWWLRPHKVRIRIGRALTFPRVEQSSAQLAAAVTDRIWPNVMLQWEWLGGLPPLRRAAVIGAGDWGTRVAELLASAGAHVDLGTADHPDVDLPASVAVVQESELELSRHDLVCLDASPSALPAVLAAHGSAIAPRAGVLVTSGRAATLVSGRVAAWAVGALAENGSSLVLAAPNQAFSRQVGDALAAAGCNLSVTADLASLPAAPVKRARAHAA